MWLHNDGALPVRQFRLRVVCFVSLVGYTFRRTVDGRLLCRLLLTLTSSRPYFLQKVHFPILQDKTNLRKKKILDCLKIKTAQGHGQEQEGRQTRSYVQVPNLMVYLRSSLATSDTLYFLQLSNEQMNE